MMIAIVGMALLLAFVTVLLAYAVAHRNRPLPHDWCPCGDTHDVGDKCPKGWAYGRYKIPSVPHYYSFDAVVRTSQPRGGHSPPAPPADTDPGRQIKEGGWPPKR